jgi:hypothetical protein
MRWITYSGEKYQTVKLWTRSLSAQDLNSPEKMYLAVYLDWDQAEQNIEYQPIKKIKGL